MSAALVSRLLLFEDFMEQVVMLTMMMMIMMSLMMMTMMIDMYIFEFWAIQLGILLVPGRYRVPRGYIFMPQVVENRLSI